MRYADIKTVDIANGPGCRVTLWVQGCSRHCPGCFNQQSWDFNGGKLFDNYAYGEIIEALYQPYIHGLTVLGGEPLEQGEELACLLADVKEIFPEKDLWVYTGYRWEELSDNQRAIIRDADVLVDGAFEESHKVLDLRFRGSTNQRFIDVQKSLEAGEVIEIELPEYETGESSYESIKRYTDAVRGIAGADDCTGAELL